MPIFIRGMVLGIAGGLAIMVVPALCVELLGFSEAVGATIAIVLTAATLFWFVGRFGTLSVPTLSLVATAAAVVVAIIYLGGVL
ncbi:MAG: hypothetical protein JJ913_10580 [Rhizobiaceae bacterium]|nr:hypothetical protein [Rhizobiaceae bacterium]